MKFIVFGILIAWMVHTVDMMSGRWLTKTFCLRPRSWGGFLGIPLSPFLHGNTAHLTENTIAFASLASLIAWQNERMLIAVTIGIGLVTGLIIWLTGRYAVIGASGLVFGYAGFLPVYGLLSGSMFSLALGILGFVSCSVMRLKVIPRDRGVSWDTHLAGLISGMVAAYFVGMRAVELAGNNF